MKANMIGLDIAKSVFQVHIAGERGAAAVSRRFGRAAAERFFAGLEPAVIGLEACGTSHHWARLLSGMGHAVRLLPAQYVKPFVKRNKTDARDAAAICVAMQQPDMRLVPMKSVAQQAARGLERSRELLVKQRTQLVNAMRAHLAELGIIAP